jgi:hypothetical protein
MRSKQLRTEVKHRNRIRRRLKHRSKKHFQLDKLTRSSEQETVAIVSNHCTRLIEVVVREKTLIRCLSQIFLFVLALPVYGQMVPETQSAPMAQEQSSGISTTVNEVSLDLIVRDKRHNGAPDLKPEDLVVTDNGEPVKLTEFRLVSGDASANRGHLITMVFDPFHGPTAKSVRTLAGRILSVLPAAGYTFSVLDFRGRLRLMQGFTTNRQAVQQAVDFLTESRPITMQPTLALPLEIIDDKAADEDRAKAAGRAEKNLIAVAQTGVDASGRHVDVKERVAAQTLLTALNDSQTILQGQHTRLAGFGEVAAEHEREKGADLFHPEPADGSCVEENAANHHWRRGSCGGKHLYDRHGYYWQLVEGRRGECFDERAESGDRNWGYTGIFCAHQGLALARRQRVRVDQPAGHRGDH